MQNDLRIIDTLTIDYFFFFIVIRLNFYSKVNIIGNKKM